MIATKKDRKPDIAQPPLPAGHEVYHVGFLARDREVSDKKTEAEKNKAIEIGITANWWMNLVENKKASIYQRRLNDFKFEYVGVLHFKNAAKS